MYVAALCDDDDDAGPLPFLNTEHMGFQHMSLCVCVFVRPQGELEELNV